MKFVALCHSTFVARAEKELNVWDAVLSPETPIQEMIEILAELGASCRRSKRRSQNPPSESPVCAESTSFNVEHIRQLRRCSWPDTMRRGSV